MKNLFITIVMAAAMAILAIFGCSAQDLVARAYDKFSNELSNGYTIMSKHIDYRDKNSGEVTGVCAVNEFYLPGKKGNLIKDLTRAMTQDGENAYHSASGKAGSKGVTYAIAYGTGKNEFELIGANSDMNFMVVCFKDKRQSDFRFSYAIEWRQDNDGSYTGKIYKIYGKKPDEVMNTSSHRPTILYSSNGNSNFTLNVDSLIDLKGHIPDLQGDLPRIPNDGFRPFGLHDFSRHVSLSPLVSFFTPQGRRCGPDYSLK